MWVADQWTDVEILDASKGEKLERWGDAFVVRPEVQAVWHTARRHPKWHDPDGRYAHDQKGGKWEKKDLPERIAVRYRNLCFHAGPMPSKHMGLFPEQAVNWDFISAKIQAAERPARNPLRVLNLFAYTGGATLAAACAGASVCHVDAARGSVALAKENAALTGLSKTAIR